MFIRCVALGSIKGISGWDVRKVTSVDEMFNGCTSLNTIDLSRWDTPSLTNMWAFLTNSGVAHIDMSNWDASNVTNIGNAFNAANLQEIKLPTDPAKGPRIDVSFSSCPGLSHDSLVNIIAWVADLNSLGLPGKTLTLGNTNKAKLSDAEKAIAQNKGWTLA